MFSVESLLQLHRAAPLSAESVGKYRLQQLASTWGLRGLSSRADGEKFQTPAASVHFKE